MLLERPGEIITRDELRNRLWQTDTFVDFDHGLNNAVLRLREVLGDSSDNPRFVETIPRRGYRFIAHVEEFFPTPPAPVHESAANQVIGAPAAPPESATDPPKGSPPLSMQLRIAVGVVGLLVILIAGVIAARYFTTRNSNSVLAGKQTTSLVVLPLENLSGDQEQDYFADGMTDELIANLAKIRSLRVISRSTAMAYKHTRKPLL